MTLKSFSLLVIVILLASCINPSVKRINQNYNEIKAVDYSLEENWATKTIELIKLGEIEKGKYVNYNSMINHETSLDETWKSVKILFDLKGEYNKSSILTYVREYKPENEIDNIIINSILKMLNQPYLYNNNYDKEINELLQSEMLVEEKLDKIFLYHLYIGKENLQLSESTISLLKEYLRNVTLPETTHDGYYYDLAYLSHNYDTINKSLNKEYWKNRLLDELDKESVNLIDIYYIFNINLIVKNELSSNLINHISQFKTEDGIFSTNKSQKNGTIFATFLSIDLLSKLKRLNMVNKDEIIEKVLKQQDVNTGGFMIRKTLNPGLIEGIVAESSLVYLDYNNRTLSSKDIEEFLFNNENGGWKFKYFGFKLIKAELSADQHLKIKKNIDAYWKQVSSLSQEELFQNIGIIENLVYTLRIVTELEGEIPKEFPNVTQFTNNILANFQDTNPVEVSIALEFKDIYDSEVLNRDDIINYLLSLYNKEYKQFIFNEHSEMMLNYYIINSLLLLNVDLKDVDLKEIDFEKIIYGFADLEKGGINLWKNQFDSSSLNSTFHGLILLDLIYNY